MIRRNFEGAGLMLTAIMALIGFLFIISIFICGGVWISERLLPGFIVLSGAISVLNLIFFIPAGFFVKNTERFSGKALLFSSFFLGFTLWLWCLILTFKAFGWLGIIIGVILLGIGVIPVGVFGALLSGNFLVLAYLLGLAVLGLIFRKAGLKILFKNLTAESFTANSQKNVDGDVIDAEYVDNGDAEL